VIKSVQKARGGVTNSQIEIEIEIERDGQTPGERDDMSEKECDEEAELMHCTCC